METIQQNKLVLFGAGKIGRSFIGQLFSRSGYEVVFIDVYKPVIDELNKKKSYRVIIRWDNDEVLTIKNVRAVHANDEPSVIWEVATAGILAVSVGSYGLEQIFPMLSKGLLKRYEIFRNSPLDIIIAENLRNANNFFYSELAKFLPKEYPLDTLVGAVETSIGKMVPLIQRKDSEEDILLVYAEPYNTLIVSKKAFRNPIPKIEGIAPKENIKAWVDRKLFIHNMGHTAIAYIGHLYNPDFKYIYEVLAVPKIKDLVLSTMLQSARILIKNYPDEFSFDEMNTHINDLLLRFQNRALGDTIFRVGCDLRRKLGPEDRFAGIINLALTDDLPFNKILFALICGCYFRAKDENGLMLKDDIDFVNRYNSNIDNILSNICGFEYASVRKIFTEAKIIEKQIAGLKLGRFDDLNL